MGLWPYTHPRVGLNIGASSLALAELRGKGKRSHLHHYKVYKILQDLVSPSPTELNIKDPVEVRKIIQRLFDEEGIRRQPVSLSLPDLAVKVLLLKFDQLPRKRKDLEQLIRWNMEKTFLSPLRGGRLSYQILDHGEGEGRKRFVLASIIQRDILSQYEEMIRSLGCYPVLIDISSFHVFNLCRGVLSKEMKPDNEFLFVNVFDSNFTIMIFNRGLPDFVRIKGFRDRVMTEEAVGGIRGEKISEEIETSIRFYSREGDADSLSNLFLFGEAQMAELVSSLESRFHLKVQFLDPQTLVAIDGFSSVKQEEIPLLIPALAAALGR